MQTNEDLTTSFSRGCALGKALKSEKSRLNTNLKTGRAFKKNQLKPKKNLKNKSGKNPSGETLFHCNFNQIDFIFRFFAVISL